MSSTVLLPCPKSVVVAKANKQAVSTKQDGTLLARHASPDQTMVRTEHTYLGHVP